MIITGRTVGSVANVMDPIREGLRGAIAAEFSDVTPAKTLGTAATAAELAHDRGIDVLVGVGGGATLDTTKQVSILCATDEPTDIARSMVHRGSVSLSTDIHPIDIVAIPTTLPGADLSHAAGVGMTMDTAVESRSSIPGGSIADPRLMPAAVFYDASIVATTPRQILTRSAMNGYDKGIEMLYSRYHTPITDATAVRGLGILQSTLPSIADGGPTVDHLSSILQGIALVQYGISSPAAYRASIIHAVGHALTAQYPIQQGAAHAIAAPHVLQYVFDRVDGRRELLADALGVIDEDDHAVAVVEAVKRTRDALGLPTQLRSVEGADPSDIPELAEAVIEDSIMAGRPEGLEPTADDLATVFDAMW